MRATAQTQTQKPRIGELLDMIDELSLECENRDKTADRDRYSKAKAIRKQTRAARLAIKRAVSRIDSIIEFIDLELDE